jgi:3-mercaptopyruvate sulfurtransferase SseA
MNRQGGWVMAGIRKALLALVATAITVGILWYTNQVPLPKEATWDDVLTEAKHGNYRLISTDELWERYNTNRKTLLLVDTRQEWEYRTGHIQGALNFPIDPTWWSRWRKKGALKSLLGPDKNRFIVFY